MEKRKAEAEARIQALREAALVGMEDADAGRFRSFDSALQLSRYLMAIADEAIAHGLLGLQLKTS